MGWLNSFFTNITVTNNISFATGYLSNGDGTFTNTPGLFLYSGAPAPGNLIFTATANNGTDKWGNKYLQGDTEYDNVTGIVVQRLSSAINFWFMSSFNPGAVFTLPTSSGLGVPFAGAAGVTAFVGGDGFQIQNNAGITLVSKYNINANGMPTVIDNTGQVYHIGLAAGSSSGPTLINSTSFTAVATVTLAPNTQYRWQICAPINTNQAAGNPIFSIGHGNTATYNVLSGSVHFSQDTDHAVTDSYVLDGSGSVGPWQGATMTVGGVYCFEGTGFVGSTLGGTMVLSAASSAAVDTFNVKHCFMSIEPMIN